MRQRNEFLRGLHAAAPGRLPRSRLWWLGFTLRWFVEQVPTVERSRRSVCLTWPRGVKTHPDLCITAYWLGWRYSKGIRWPERPRNIAGIDGGHYWHWPLGLGYIDWFGQRLYK